MITQYANDGIVIRRAERKDEQELAELAYIAYYDRFFNDAVTDKYQVTRLRLTRLRHDATNRQHQSQHKDQSLHTSGQLLCLSN